MCARPARSTSRSFPASGRVRRSRGRIPGLLLATALLLAPAWPSSPFREPPRPGSPSGASPLPDAGSTAVSRIGSVPSAPAGSILLAGDGRVPRSPNADSLRFASLRQRMVEEQIRRRGITDPAVLAAMERVERHRFVPDALRDAAYSDRPLPIGLEQTISQPYIVALMTELARPRPGARALDVGTGSGYQAAVLAEIVGAVYGIEILCPLAGQAATRLGALGYTNVEVRCGDGYRGWPEHAPFDLILVAAAPDHVPQPLVEQLAPGGRLVLPVGDLFQELVVIEKSDEGEVRRESVVPVRFVPMTGEAEQGQRGPGPPR